MDQERDDAYEGDERELLKRALQASGMSARQAASKMDISDTRLRHIINGYQPVGRGQRIHVVAPEDTLARIAMVLDVSPEELEAAGRADAAHELRKRIREQHDLGDDSGAVIEAIQEWAEDPVNYLPPDDALRFFDDSALLGEVGRRLGILRAMARGDVRHGFWDTAGHPTVETVEAAKELPGLSGDDLSRIRRELEAEFGTDLRGEPEEIAAHDSAGTIEEEQEAPEHP